LGEQSLKSVFNKKSHREVLERKEAETGELLETKEMHIKQIEVRC
jgi:hypothetical protein